MVKKKHWYQKPLLYLVMLALLVLFLFPFFIALMNSFKSLSEILLNPLSMPQTLHWDNYTKALKALNILLSLKNTAVITICSVALIIVFTSMSAYWITRHPHGWPKVLEKFIIGSALVPFATLMLPLIMVIRQLHLVNTYAAGVLTYLGIGFPLAYLIMRGAAKAVPFDMDEAALVH